MNQAVAYSSQSQYIVNSYFVVTYLLYNIIVSNLIYDIVLRYLIQWRKSVEEDKHKNTGQNAGY